MPDTLIADAQSFLGKLKQNNEKAWWDEHKPTYDAKLKAPALDLLERLEPVLAKLADDPIKTKLFRPHRDVRFSKDKTPYKTYLHMMWTPQTGGRANPAYFFGIDPDTVTVAGGMMGMDKPVLEDWRKMVDLDGERIGGIVQELKDRGYDHWGEPALKRVPKPWDQDHPLADLLRRKSVVMSRHISPTGSLTDALEVEFKALTKLTKMLTGIAFG